MSYTNFPAYLMDSVAICRQGHATLRPTPHEANNAPCPKCSGAQAKEPTPRSLDPESWGTAYGGDERVRASRQRGIENSREVRRAAS